MILVTGGCGFIGAALTKALVRSGEQVRVFDNMSRGDAKRLADVDVEIVEGDVRDDIALIKAAEGCDALIHLACINGTENFYKRPHDVLDVGTRGMQSVLDAVATYGIPTMMLASSSEVYQTPPVIPTSEDVPLSIPDPFNPRYSYAAVKIISEMQAIYCCSAPRVLIIRPHNIYGPDMGHEHVIPQMAERILKHGQLEFAGEAPISASQWAGPRPFWGGGETRAFCHIDDAVEQIILVLKRGLDRTIYNIGSDEEIAIYDLAAKIASAAGKPLRVVDGVAAKGGTLRRCPDMSRTYALGAVPTSSLDVGLTETLCWYWGQS